VLSCNEQRVEEALHVGRMCGILNSRSAGIWTDRRPGITGATPFKSPVNPTRRSLDRASARGLQQLASSVRRGPQLEMQATREPVFEACPETRPSQRSTTPVTTPVWLVALDGKIYVFTAHSTGKAKRVRATGRVRFAPCSMNGRRILGEWREGTGRVVHEVARSAEMEARARSWRSRCVRSSQGPVAPPTPVMTRSERRGPETRRDQAVREVNARAASAVRPAPRSARTSRRRPRGVA
jgi:PPOX class probable F420-dependent enzyme